MWSLLLEFIGYLLLLIGFALFPEIMGKIFSDRKYHGKGEELACRALREIAGCDVKCNIRPNFLRNPETGKNLELDCFTPRNQTAIEYDGIQHFEYPNPFHRSKKEFEKQVQRDKIKDKLCESNGINLIRVPYTVDKNKKGEKRYSAIKNYIWERIKFF